MQLLLALAIGLAVFFNLRALAGNHRDAWWARLLFRPHGPRTDVRYLTRRELLRSGLLSCCLAAGLGALQVLAVLVPQRSFDRHPALFAAWLSLSFLLTFLCLLFALSGIILVVRGLCRSSRYVPPVPKEKEIEHTPYLAIDDSWYRKPAGVPEHVSCGGVVARVERGTVLIALLKEDGFLRLVLPKGHLERGESLEQAARREIAEESGLTDLRLLCEIGVRERLDLKKRSWKTTHYFLFSTTQRSGHPTDAHHTYVLEWSPLDRLPDMFWPEQEELVRTNTAMIKSALFRP
ncbi:MAG: NUDIX domain-containing protein [Candidatus Edwardsbacteria bacterium]|jgi:8-oxo-dGTP pyrophosphatase MutT (NUDIX family)|nr:NUDIX domain-containing protein [Candidatus Edwardsbacteria bacterium]